MFLWLCSCMHSCKARSCKRGLASRWKDRRRWKKLKRCCWSLPVSLVASVCRCRCQPAGNPATPWLWFTLLAGVAQYLSAKSLAWALLLHPFYFILCLKDSVLFISASWSFVEFTKGSVTNSEHFENKPADSLRSSTDNKPLFLPCARLYIYTVYFVCGHLKGFILCRNSMK